MMESNRQGDATEAIVLAELKKRDISVSLPFGDNERYDAVIEEPNGDLSKVQIKTGWKESGTIRFHTKTQHTNSQGHVYKPYGDQVDYFVVYSPDTGEAYLIEEDEFDKTIWLRVDKPERGDRSINWASDYEFDERWPPSDEEHSATQSTVEDKCRDALEAQNVLYTVAPEESVGDFLIEGATGEYFRAVGVPCWITEGRIRFNSSCLSDSVDLILLYSEATENAYLVRTDEFETSMSLRVEEPQRDRSDINLAENYELQNRAECLLRTN